MGQVLRGYGKSQILVLKVSANPKLTVLHNFGLLYDSINLRNSFHLKTIQKKMLFICEVI